MEISFNFIDDTDREISLAIQHNDDDIDTDICSIMAEYKPSNEDLEGVGVVFSISTTDQLDDLISALQFIRTKAQERINRNVPHFTHTDILPHIERAMYEGVERFAQKWSQEQYVYNEQSS